MSIAALARNPSRTAAAWKAATALGRSFVRLIQRRMKVGKDARTLQTLPAHVLADMGLERIEIMSGTNGTREVWVIPPRYY